ncbi:hypothetical protein GOP47_0017787 [Adiantum capillus-veneris]|uniref:N-acetyltransferase domain-containing protein n=1 Tax=Adiantum capillus-veneris TaxID=13818 RepID=A0A9D4UH09_ADICA|nr:hypothetical protein GOP47_0017787 [Adiantum capillus-veneris]
MGRAHDVPVSFDNVRDKNLMLLTKLNIAIFPVKYDGRYYTDAISSGDFTKLAYYGDICVGSIACRLDRVNANVMRLYIMTFGILASYRRLGIGSKLMKHILDLCRQDVTVSEIYLHVQTNNQEALAFYQKFGFEVREKIENYYTDIEPPDCYLLVKNLPSSSKGRGVA